MRRLLEALKWMSETQPPIAEGSSDSRFADKSSVVTCHERVLGGVNSCEEALQQPIVGLCLGSWAAFRDQLPIAEGSSDSRFADRSSVVTCVPSSQ